MERSTVSSSFPVRKKNSVSKTKRIKECDEEEIYLLSRTYLISIHWSIDCRGLSFVSTFSKYNTVTFLFVQVVDYKPMNTQPATLHGAIHRLQDTAFLGAYTLALRQNATVLHGKTILILGDGVGFLSIVAAQIGCAKVYALENSELADDIPLLAASNGVGDKVIAVRAKVTDPHADQLIPEKVDVVLTMPLSLLCLHDSPLRELAIARDRW